MSLDVTNFQDIVVRENKAILKALFSQSANKYALYQYGNKGSMSIPVVSKTGSLQQGKCVGKNGTVVMEEVLVNVLPYTSYFDICADDLQAKYNQVLAPGSNNEGDIPDSVEEGIVLTEVSNIGEELSFNAWQGDTAGSGYTFTDGFIKMIDTKNVSIDGNTSNATEITKGNVIGLVDDMIVAMPQKVKRAGDAVLLVGSDVFELYIQALKAANLYHYDPEMAINGMYKVPGTKVTMIDEYGLEATDRMFAGFGGNFILSSDVEGEQEIMEVWYSKDEDKVNFRTKFKFGLGLANADEITEFTLSA
ncbi:hypothetical protein [Cochleicola gelatinilyticus]|uniref:Phage capsid protein n=1 Tax=Cochleicola gelatinilyticus TaxID=1763537 RepID=A0A167HMM0_9FLAO|nr:hypothetical protein [Cochleicola gelatinilyticus]OAB78775.1 hypothetical protein ULVI_09340 [Cochleicola gelatinilyticus]